MPSKSSEFHPVIAAILERHQKKSKPQKRKDPYKIGLVVEGGSMRAIVSAAELVAIEQMGLKICFDIVYSESIGAGNAAHFLSSQLAKSIDIYYKHVNNKVFINLLRFLIGRPVVDIDFFMEVAEKAHPLDFQAFQKSGVTLKILATKVDYQSTSNFAKRPLVSFSEFRDKYDLLGAIRAAIHMPVWSGELISYKRMRLLDGGIVDKFPVQEAIADGCTHILALSTNPANYVPKQYNFLERLATTNYLNRLNPDLSRHFLQSQAVHYKKTLEMLRIKNKTKEGPPFIFTIFMLNSMKRVHHFEMDSKVLLEAKDIAMKETFKAFGHRS